MVKNNERNTKARAHDAGFAGFAGFVRLACDVTKVPNHSEI
jgi:hypothetical protein